MSNKVSTKEYQSQLGEMRDMIDKLMQINSYGLYDYRKFILKIVSKKRLPKPCPLEKCSYCGVHSGKSLRDELKDHFWNIQKEIIDTLFDWSSKVNYQEDYYGPTIIYLTIRKLSLLNIECMCPHSEGINKLRTKDNGWGEYGDIIGYANNYFFFRTAIDCQMEVINSTERSLARGLLEVYRKCNLRYLPKPQNNNERINMLCSALNLGTEIGLLKKKPLKKGGKEYYMLDNIYDDNNRLLDEINMKRAYILLIARLSENLSIGKRIKEKYHNINWKSFESFFGKDIIKSCKVRLANLEHPADLKATNYKKFEEALGERIVEQIRQVADSCLFGNSQNHHLTTT